MRPWLAACIVALLCSSCVHARLVVIYSYYISLPNLAQPDTDNLVFFANTGVYPNDPRVTYIFLFVANDLTATKASFMKSDLRQALPFALSNFSNVQIEWSRNGIYDLCNYKLLISKSFFTHYIEQSATRFFFLNAAVRGPFRPFYAQTTPWWDPFDQLMVGNVSLVGSSMNCEHAPHVQSFAFMVDKIAFQIARETWQCPSPTVRKHGVLRNEYVIRNEVGFSRNVIAASRSFATLLASHAHYDSRDLGHSVPCTMENPTARGHYYGAHPTPYEVMFPKNAGDVYREKLIPEHATAIIQVYTKAESVRWAHEPARKWFSEPCVSKQPTKEAKCIEERWVINGDWRISKHAILHGDVQVNGSVILEHSATLEIELSRPTVCVLKIAGAARMRGEVVLSFQSMPSGPLLLAPLTQVLACAQQLEWTSSVKVKQVRAHFIGGFLTVIQRGFYTYDWKLLLTRKKAAMQFTRVLSITNTLWLTVEIIVGIVFVWTVHRTCKLRRNKVTV